MSVFQAIIYKIVTVSYIKIFKTNIFCLITGYWQLLGHLENNYMFHHYKLEVIQQRQNYGWMASRISLLFILSGIVFYSAFQSLTTLVGGECPHFKKQHIQCHLYEFQNASTEAFKKFMQCIQMQWSLIYQLRFKF